MAYICYTKSLTTKWEQLIPVSHVCPMTENLSNSAGDRTMILDLHFSP